jgi:aminocarboxymuconate-semialdehyde decarboxylase
MGSDYCFDIGYDEPVKFITGMKSLNDKEREQILWSNAARYLKLT